MIIRSLRLVGVILTALLANQVVQAAPPINQVITLFHDGTGACFAVSNDPSANGLIVATPFDKSPYLFTQFYVRDVGDGSGRIMLQSFVNNATLNRHDPNGKDRYVIQRFDSLDDILYADTSYEDARNNPACHFTWHEVSDGKVRLIAAESGGTSGKVVGRISPGRFAADFELIGNLSNVTFSWSVVTKSPSPELPTPRVAKVLYSHTDVPWYDVDVVADPRYKADNTGATDASVVIQRAMDDLAKTGQSTTLFLPAGRYKLTKKLTMYENVELRGDWKRQSPGDMTAGGTILCVEHGEGTVSSYQYLDVEDPRGLLDSQAELDAYIAAKGDVAIDGGGQCTITDITIYYPNQKFTSDPDSKPIPYPYTLLIKGRKVGGNGGAATVKLRNVTFLNSYDLAWVQDCSPDIQGIFGTSLHHGFMSYSTTSTPRYYNINLGPKYWGESGLDNPPSTQVIRDKMRAPGNDSVGVFNTGGAGALIWLGFTIEGYDRGFITNKVAGRFYDMQITDCRIAWAPTTTHSLAYEITRARLQGDECALLLPDRSDHFRANGVEFIGGQNAVRVNDGYASFVNCTFKGWDWQNDQYGIVCGKDKISTAVNASKPILHVAGCTFEEGRTKHIRIGANTFQANIYANVPWGETLDVLNNGAVNSDRWYSIDRTSTHKFAQMDPQERITDIMKYERHIPIPSNPAHVINVRSPEYGAYGYASAYDDPYADHFDDTDNIQRALNAAGAIAKPDAGCIVYFPPGYYRVMGHLDVPSNVELRGRNATLCLFADRGNPSARATIKLAENSGINTLRIAHPEQKYFLEGGISDEETNAYIDKTLVPYPFAIEGTDRNWAVQVSLANLYNGIDFSKGGRHWLDYCRGCALNDCFKVAGETGLSTIINCVTGDSIFAGWGANCGTTDFGLGSAQKNDQVYGMNKLGSGFVITGDGPVRMIGSNPRSCGHGNTRVDGSPTLNVILTGGEECFDIGRYGEEVGYFVVLSQDGKKAHIENLNPSYVDGGPFINAFTDEGDVIKDICGRGYWYTQDVTWKNNSTGNSTFIIQQTRLGGNNGIYAQSIGPGTTIIEGSMTGNGIDRTWINVTGLAQGGVYGVMPNDIGTHDISMDKLSFLPENEYNVYVEGIHPTGSLKRVTGRGGALTPPLAPAGLIAQPGASSVILDWDPVQDSDLASYKIYRAVNKGFYTPIATNIIANKFTDTKRTVGATYHYVVTAVDARGNESAISNEVSLTVLAEKPPTATTGLVANGYDQEIALSWAKNPERKIAGYNIYRSEIPGTGYILVGSSTTNTYSDKGLTNFKTYYYVVTAVNANGYESFFKSNEVVAVAGVTAYAPSTQTTTHGSVVGSTAVLSTNRDGAYQTLNEVVADNTSKLEHRWAFTLPSSEFRQFVVQAYHTVNAERDDFSFAYSIDGVNYTNMVVVKDTTEPSQPVEYSIPGGLSGTVYIRVVDTDRTIGNYKLDSLVVNVLTVKAFKSDAIPEPASVIEPLDNAQNVSNTPMLAWTSSPLASAHKVYFGTTAVLGESDLKSTQTSTVYYPGVLQFGTTYYWRVDEVNSKGTQTGVTWTFRTSDADTFGPQPNPLTFEEAPRAVSSTSITMKSSIATDPSVGAVQYRFVINDSYYGGWTVNRTLTLTGLTPGQTVKCQVRAKDSVGNLGDVSEPVFVTTPLPDWERWSQANFGSYTDVARNADPDLDGIVNLLEYALGGNPKVAGASPTKTSLEGDRLTMSFPCALLDTTVTLKVQGADSLSGPWTDLASCVGGGAFKSLVTGVVVSEAGAPGSRTIKVQDMYLVTDPAHPRRFMRIQAVKP